MKTGTGIMKKFGTGWIWLPLALCLAAGCIDGLRDVDDLKKPAVDANGAWNVREDGVFLGVMTLRMTAGGALDGSLTTEQGAEAKLSGTLGGYEAQFTMIFPAEYYEVTLTFSADAASANGFAEDAKGFTRTLVLARLSGP
jgi:hypothetical protein